MDQVGFRGPQVCSIVGITYRQLDYWDRTGLSRPSLAKARGSGTQRLYAYKDLLELKVIKQLLDGGVNLRQARRAIECLRESVGEDLTTANLVIVGEGSVLMRTGEQIIDLLRGGQGVFNVVPLAEWSVRSMQRSAASIAPNDDQCVGVFGCGGQTLPAPQRSPGLPGWPREDKRSPTGHRSGFTSRHCAPRCGLLMILSACLRSFSTTTKFSGSTSPWSLSSHGDPMGNRRVRSARIST